VNVAEETSQAAECWERLYDDKAAALILYGRALGLSHSEAEDVLQETFIALLARAETPEEPEHYAYRAFRNRTLNFKRSLWRRVAREFESARWFEQDGGESPQERAAMRCLDKLPPEQREVIVLKIWSERTFDEIARLLDLSPNTVAGRYRYGLAKLRACLAPGQEKNANEYEPLELPGESIGKMDATATFA